MAALSKTFVLRNDGNAAALYAFLKHNWRAMAEAGKPLAVTVSEHKERRSTAMNARYWALLTCISEQVWIGGKTFAPETWHEHFRDSFAPKEDSPGGLKAMSTARMDVEQFSKYMDEVIVHASSTLGVTL
jgi:hypothetical protein